MPEGELLEKLAYDVDIGASQYYMPQYEENYDIDIKQGVSGENPEGWTLVIDINAFEAVGESQFHHLILTGGNTQSVAGQIFKHLVLLRSGHLGSTLEIVESGPKVDLTYPLGQPLRG